MKILVATRDRLLRVEVETGSVRQAKDLAGRPLTCLAADPYAAGRAWCGTSRSGLWRTDDAGASWRRVGLEGEELTAVAASQVDPGRVWAGTEPSALWRSEDAGDSWRSTTGLGRLPSASEWAFPPRPETHHVRWIACHPHEEGRLWLAIEAGALVATPDGGETWHDRVAGGPYDTHELSIHPARPETLRVAAGDGYFESDDGGATWRAPTEGLEARYLLSVVIDPGDPETVVVSAASRPHAAYTTGLSDGRLFRRQGSGPWHRIHHGWPDPPHTIAPLLVAGASHGELWAADERGVHRSSDGGQTWDQIAHFEPMPSGLRGLAVLTIG